MGKIKDMIRQDAVEYLYIDAGIRLAAQMSIVVDDRIKQKTVSDIQQTYKKHLKIAKELYNKKFGE